MIRKKQEFIVGLDWLINDDNKPFLLEFNMRRKGEGDDISYSKPLHFFQVSLDKLLQHQLVGEFMPDYTRDKEKFNEFINQKKRVVYKLGSGSQGSGVSVLEIPKWEPDLVEEFIQPRAQIVGGKHYFYVIRDYQIVSATNNDFSWRRKKVFRKQSKVALEDSKDDNAILRINTCNGASRTDATEGEEQLTLEKTDELMKRIREQGKYCDWNPTKLYKSAIVGYYSGYRLAIFGGYPDYFSEVARILGKRSIDFTPFYISNGLLKAIRASEYGSDMVVLTDYHSIKWDEMRTAYKIRRNIKGNIEHVREDKVFETFPSRGNIIITGEFSPSQVADRIADNYKKRRLQ